MVKALILYYLNIKETHGYEIQKFLQLNGMDTWANIKAGSIYYALSKMEKNGEIDLVREETKVSRVRKIYRITEKGRKELKVTLEKELDKPLLPVNVEKFILPITINRLNKEKSISILNNHIKGLNEALDYWKHWKKIKTSGACLEIERIAFEMTIANFEYAISWHKALIKEYDIIKNVSQQQEQIIATFNFGEESENKHLEKINVEKISELRETILNNPDKSKEALETLITLMSSN
ncbi:PadR family transcriptional regulator [Clostridium tagluense]|uniref:PadR family transcriptional regulator n=1 Tax=Clostridium tagluense TaxID=360422 RepID=UPI001CF3429E|nr:PadR family transcriptional regulator [Clostridium tagluense]MCB2296236.1 PadR family transcriptional regulator [Clostridium tagluense]